MRTLKQIAYEAKMIRAEAKRRLANLKTEADAVRAAKLAEKTAKAEAKAAKGKARAEKTAKSEHKAKAKAQAETQAERAARNKREASDLLDRCRDHMKAMHPDMGGPGGPAFHTAHKAWKNAQTAYHMYA